MKTDVKKRAQLYIMLLAAVLLLASGGAAKPVQAASSKLAVVHVKRKSSNTKRIILQWNRVSNARGYVVYRKNVGGKFKRIDVIKNRNTVNYTDTKILDGNVYVYAVRAYSRENGKTIYSGYTARSIAARPKAPRITAKAASDGKVTLSWPDVAREDGYIVYRKVNDAKNWSTLRKLKANQTSYIDSGAVSGVSYSYCVKSYKMAGSVTYLSVESNNCQINPPASGKLTSAQKDALKKILYAVETGGQVYGNQDYADFTEAYTNGSGEHAITIGAGQWYATEAQRLLKLIYSTSPATFKNIDKNGRLYNDVLHANWSTYKLKKTSGKAKKIVKIINTPVGRKCQDQLMYQQIAEYDAEVRRFGVSNARAVCMCINLRHLGGIGSVERVLAKTKKPYTMNKIWKAMQSDTGNQVGAPMYRTRHQKVMTWIKEYI